MVTDHLFSKETLKGWIFFLLAGSFFLYEFFCRASMGPMEMLFRNDLNISVATVGMVSSAFYLAYSLMQIPVGLLVDKFGVRRIGLFAIMLTAVGALLFSLSYTVTIAWVGRFVIGVGAAFGYVLMFKIILEWFPHKHLGFMGGMTQILGMIGPLIAGVPLTLALQSTHGDWRLIFYCVAFFGVILAILFYSIVRDSEENSTQKIKGEHYHIFQHIKNMIKYKQLWAIAIYVFFAYGSIELLGSLFGMTYLEKIGYSAVDSASIVAFLWLGLGVGSPIIGIISDRLQRRKVVLLGCSILGAFASAVFIWLPINSYFLDCILFLCIGTAAGAQSLSFPTVVENIPSELEGASIGFNNMFVILGASVIQMLGGWLITLFSNQDQVSQHYSLDGQQILHAYQLGLSISIIFFVISLILGFLFIKETRCKRLV